MFEELNLGQEDKIKLLEERIAKIAQENEAYKNNQSLMVQDDTQNLDPQYVRKNLQELENDKKFLQAQLEKSEQTILANENTIFELKNKEKMYKEVEACHISEIEILMKELSECKRIVGQMEILADKRKYSKSREFTGAELLARNNVLKDTVDRYRQENTNLQNKTKNVKRGNSKMNY